MVEVGWRRRTRGVGVEPRTHPLDRPFAALVRLDGADTPLLHALDCGAPMQPGTRRIRWVETGHLSDIECFELEA
jgi:hypothetical protein